LVTKEHLVRRVEAEQELSFHVFAYSKIAVNENKKKEERKWT
jgi:hypothetical protein